MRWMRDVESDAAQFSNGFVDQVEGTLGAPDKGSCQSVAKRRAYAQSRETRAAASDLAVIASLLQVVVDPCSHNGLGASCSYG